jgi:diguanylate cyclase (GGDEF)-like protein
VTGFRDVAILFMHTVPPLLYDSMQRIWYEWGRGLKLIMHKRLGNFLMFSPQFSAAEQELKYKFIFLNNVFFFAAIVAFGMGFIRWQASTLMGSLDFAFCAIDLGLLFYLRHHTDKVELVSSLALILSFILFFAIYLLAPYNKIRLSLFFLLSASAFFLKGRKTGFLWLVFILLSIGAGHALPYVDTAYSLVDILTTSLYLIALFFIFDKYEAIRDEQKLRLEQLNMHLEQEVLDRTRDLQQANSALQAERQLLENLSSTDQLTGLYNRHKFEDLFQFELNQALRYKTGISIILLDIDYFKSVNDNFGHNVGDTVLKELASVLRSSVRSSDVVVRWGGEEFVVFAPKTTLEQARQLAEAIRQKVKSATLTEVGHLTTSLGVASLTAGDSLESLVHRADRALYRAKDLGRDNVQIEMNVLIGMSLQKS